jgi:hypothetical protein
MTSVFGGEKKSIIMLLPPSSSPHFGGSGDQHDHNTTSFPNIFSMSHHDDVVGFVVSLPFIRGIQQYTTQYTTIMP